MKLFNYTIIKNTLLLYFENGHRAVIFLNHNSGKVYYRYKIDTLSDVKHPGIYLGTDTVGTHYFIHNHYETKRPSIVTREDFSKGHQLFPHELTVTNSASSIVENALQSVINGKAYEAFTFNCQTFVNEVCNNRAHSEDVQKWMGRILLSATIILGIRFFNN